MKVKKKSLQKFTESENKIKAVLKLKKITWEDLKPLTKKELNLLSEVLKPLVNNSKGVERDKLFKKIDAVTNEETKNETWEHNHIKITWAISTLMQELNRMPSKRELADKTGLSRQTINKHLKEYHTHPLYEGQIEQFKFMRSNVLSRVYFFALQGDMKAAKLYFDILGTNTLLVNNTSIQNQNNFIQINNTLINQENIKLLNPEQLNSIEDILKTTISSNRLQNEILQNTTEISHHSSR